MLMYNTKIRACTFWKKTPKTFPFNIAEKNVFKEEAIE